jgi:hypothetical protein
MKNNTIDLFFSEESAITGKNFPAMMENTFLQEQLAGASHFSCRASACLDRKFPNGWLGRAGPIPSLLCSPNLNTFTYFLLGEGDAVKDPF